jgi:hypothetical protein
MAAVAAVAVVTEKAPQRNTGSAMRKNWGNSLGHRLRHIEPDAHRLLDI